MMKSTGTDAPKEESESDFVSEDTSFRNFQKYKENELYMFGNLLDYIPIRTLDNKSIIYYNYENKQAVWVRLKEKVYIIGYRHNMHPKSPIMPFDFKNPKESRFYKMAKREYIVKTGDLGCCGCCWC